MARATEKLYTEMEIKQLVQNEIRSCFEDLSSDVKEIKKALLGDGEYQKTGLVAKVEKHEEYIERSNALNIIGRAQPALSWYESWEKNNTFKMIEETLDAYSKWKWFVGLIAGGSLAGIVSAIVTIVELVKRFSV